MTSSSDLFESARPKLVVGEVMDKSARENFSVASHLLPRRHRVHLLALYGYARFVDDIGDLAVGDRLAQLDWAEAELQRALAGVGTHPVFVSAAETARALEIDERPFLDLIEANRQDQRVTRYESFGDLEQYCRLSANPVGRMVLAVFGARDTSACEISDRVCTGLQLVEHWQDVAEDAATGRIYVPLEDLRRFGVDEDELTSDHATPEFRRMMAFEVGRARELLASGRPLVAMMPGAGRLAVAGFIAGGRANLDAIEAAEYDVLAAPRKASRAAVARQTLAVAIASYGRNR